MQRNALLALILPALAVTACAHSTDEYQLPPDFRPIETQPAANARYYADCIAEASIAGRYGRAHDESTELVLFTCTGAPARAFYDALGPWMQQTESSPRADGRTFRSTNRVQRDLFGVDYCSTDGAGDFRCVISLNAGAFVAQ